MIKLYLGRDLLASGRGILSSRKRVGVETWEFRSAISDVCTGSYYLEHLSIENFIWMHSKIKDRGIKRSYSEVALMSPFLVGAADGRVRFPAPGNITAMLYAKFSHCSRYTGPINPSTAQIVQIF